MRLILGTEAEVFWEHTPSRNGWGAHAQGGRPRTSESGPWPWLIIPRGQRCDDGQSTKVRGTGTEGQNDINSSQFSTECFYLVKD